MHKFTVDHPNLRNFLYNKLGKKTFDLCSFHQPFLETNKADSASKQMESCFAKLCRRNNLLLFCESKSKHDRQFTKKDTQVTEI